MAVDFMNPHLKPKISCDNCSLENYSVQNLISENPVERSRGFMCESFVSPPVTVTVEFPCQVEIESIVLDPWVSSQKSCGFQVQTKCKEVKSWLVEGDGSRTNDAVVDLTEEPGLIARRFERNEDIAHPTFMFTNCYFRDRREFKDLRMPKRHFSGGKEIVTSMRNKEYKHTTKVSHLLITINGTLARTIPCIKQLAVYGQPSKSCPRNVVDRVISILQALQEAPISVPIQPEIPANIETESCKVIETDTTPWEYSDEITFELMSMPILLPSGHNIDQRTLDRFIAEEAVWGRVASDPFTGLPLGENKPIVNSGLKARIDQYIVKERIENVGRTVGRDTAKSTHVVGNSEVPCTSKRKRCDELSPKSVNKKKANSFKVPARVDYRKPTVPTLTSLIAPKSAANTSPKLAESNNQNQKSMETPELSKSANCGINHDDNLQASLEDALGATLRNLPSFTAPKKQPTNVCSECAKKLVPHKIYKISCEHFLCDKCVKNCRKCRICSKEFSNHDVVKTNL